MVKLATSLERARTLRREMTDAERRLWRVLRSRQLERYKFRRQQPMRWYILDFVCFSHRLAIEVDGGQHVDAVEYDKRRTRFLEREGFRVLRFWNREILENAEAVCQQILEALREPRPSPRPSPTRGEGEVRAVSKSPLPLRERSRAAASG